ncbi:hypothetical protein [Neobacillus sp. LXY-1]|uniref:hypothetical protein n=1 Tax=Neobacillus sp. LXY-1 TaxID=3379133 RepID=UPI003EE10591
MYVVHFFENKNALLVQLRNSLPAEGDNLTIKGRKGKVSSVNNIDEKMIHVQVILEVVNKNKQIVDLSKKKKR